MASDTHSLHSAHCACAVNLTLTQQSLDELSFERGLWPAAQQGDVARVVQLLAKRRSADEQDSAGLTALH